MGCFHLFVPCFQQVFQSLRMMGNKWMHYSSFMEIHSKLCIKLDWTRCSSGVSPWFRRSKWPSLDGAPRQTGSHGERTVNPQLWRPSSVSRLTTYCPLLGYVPCRIYSRIIQSIFQHRINFQCTGCSVCFCTVLPYEGHSQIINAPWAFWAWGEIKNSSDSKVKREDWTGRNREKIGQRCPNTKTRTI